MNHISRIEAVDLGLTRYFTGTLCSKGHIAQRFVDSYGCVECRNEAKRAKDPIQFMQEKGFLL